MRVAQECDLGEARSRVLEPLGAALNGHGKDSGEPMRSREVERDTAACKRKDMWIQ